MTTNIAWRVRFVDRHGHDHSSPSGAQVGVAGFRIPKAMMIDSRRGPGVQMVSAIAQKLFCGEVLQWT